MLTGPCRAPVQRIYSFDQQTSLNSIREVSATANDSAAAKDIQLAQVLHLWGLLPVAFTRTQRQGTSQEVGGLSASMVGHGLLPGACLVDIM